MFSPLCEKLSRRYHSWGCSHACWSCVLHDLLTTFLPFLAGIAAGPLAPGLSHYFCKSAAIHAGLECGIIGERVKGMDAVSYGPTIRGAHSPDERVRGRFRMLPLHGTCDLLVPNEGQPVGHIEG